MGYMTFLHIVSHIDAELHIQLIGWQFGQAKPTPNPYIRTNLGHVLFQHLLNVFSVGVKTFYLQGKAWFLCALISACN
jgi:hypothetical protein